MSGKYDDIIHLPRHVSKTRPKMAIIDRAAQFAPFAALSGHDSAVKETARLTDERTVLDQYQKDAISERLQIISDLIKEQPEVSITYFQPDAKKQGGAYLIVSGTVKKIDEYERVVNMTDGTKILIDEIFGIEGKIFEITCDQE